MWSGNSTPSNPASDKTQSGGGFSAGMNFSQQLTLRMSPQEKAEIQGLAVSCFRETTIKHGTPCAIATVAVLYGLKRRGFFDKWNMLSKIILFGWAPVTVMLAVDLKVFPNQPCANRIQNRLRELAIKYSEIDKQSAALQSPGEMPRSIGGKLVPGKALTYEQLREANRSGRRLKVAEQQQTGQEEDSFKPKSNGKSMDLDPLGGIPTSKSEGVYMSGTPTGGPNSKERGMPKNTFADSPPASSSFDFGFELLPAPSDTDYQDSKAPPKRDEQKSRQRGGGYSSF